MRAMRRGSFAPFLLCALGTVPAVAVVPPCRNFSGLYSGMLVSTDPATGDIRSVVPENASAPYAHFGRGRGNMTSGDPAKGWTHASVVFEATGTQLWAGQFRGCAQLTISLQRGAHYHSSNSNGASQRGEYMILTRDSHGATPFTGPSTAAPAWTQDMVVYEIAPKGFTSPNGTGATGDGSGTFRSLQGRVPYLADLGITAVWLAGLLCYGS